SKALLHQRVVDIQARLAEDKNWSAAGICRAMGTGRGAFPHRLAVISNDESELVSRMQLLSENRGPDTGIYHGVVKSGQFRTAFLFSGQGSQYPLMGWSLCQTVPVFREQLERCAAVLDPLLGRPLL